MNIDAFEKEVCAALGLYGDNVMKEVRVAVDGAAKAGLEVLKAEGSYKDKSGRYRKSFRIQKEDSYRKAERVLYASGRQYTLTHLLERGHVTRDGTTRTRAFPHWAQAEKAAVKKCAEDVEKAVEGAGI